MSTPETHLPDKPATMTRPATPHIDGISDTGDGYSIERQKPSWHLKCLWCEFCVLAPLKRDCIASYREHERHSLNDENEALAAHHDGLVTVLSGRYMWRRGIFRGWSSRNGEPPCAEVDLLPAGRAQARRVRVTTLGHFRCLDSLCGLCRVEERAS